MISSCEIKQFLHFDPTHGFGERKDKKKYECNELQLLFFYIFCVFSKVSDKFPHPPPTNHPLTQPTENTEKQNSTHNGYTLSTRI